MREYDFEVEEIKEENNNNYTSYGSESGSPKKPKKHTALKVAAAVFALVFVSAGSIGAYKVVSDRIHISSVVDFKTDISTSDDGLKADTVSLIRTEEQKSGELAAEDIVDKLLPSVVGIESKFTVTSNGGSGFYFGFGGMGGSPSSSTATATGTGVVITENGYIVTNAHVIYDSEYGAGEADSINVILSDQNSYEAEIVGYDTDCDLAVLKINAEGLTAAEFGDSDSLRLGESVIAIGNPLGFDLMNTVTGGMVSGLNRHITINDKAMTLIQTDAAINSGNSGGPLINKCGQVIGINSSKMSSTYYGEASIEGIGFAIPSNEVSAIVDDLMKYGYVTGKPQIGISCQDVTETISSMYNIPMGVYVTAVSDDSAAEQAGLRTGDVITAVDGVEVRTSEELNAQKNLHSAGDKIEVTFIRNGEEQTVAITLDEVMNKN